MTSYRKTDDRSPEMAAPGLADELFVRGAVPMTKLEVRAVTIAMARLAQHHRILDIGAGTGSLSIEAAMLCSKGEVVALERNVRAVALVRENVARLGVTTVRILLGEAPEAFAELSPASFDRIFVGGSGGKLGAILGALPALLRPQGRVVCNTTCVETTAQVTTALRQSPWVDFSTRLISVARGELAGSLVRFAALNPVWITSASLGEEG